MSEQETTGMKSRGPQGQPVLALNRITFKKLRVQIRSETYELLTRYIKFYEDATEKTPDESELVDAALKRAFQKDRGFQNYLKNGGQGAGQNKGK
ncbi:MAG TPA: hypothetical protein VJ875_03000 [Pyrinomonadaceae bacterium]|nr:hypothetical protein [Pyrinomonadaceae bacterium]